MAKNDIVIVDNIVKERINSKTPSSDLGEVFEFFAFEQVLKDYDLSVDQIIDGVTDGRNDGGIDGFYIFINGNYLEDVKSFMWPKKSCEIKIYILSAKHHDTFEKALLDDQYSTICELLDLSIETKNFKTQYNDELVSKRDFFVEAYRRTSANLVSMEIDFYYLSRGDSDIVGENVVARANQIKAEIENFFSECDVSYSFFGSSELIKQYRKNKDFKLKLKYSKVLNNSGHNFIALCPIGEYFNFITFSDKKLRRYLFDSNVRAYMGLNRVNDDILESLKTNISIDFWYLNNGITILATGARDLGNYIEIDNAQIVNGLQTSETIFHYFSNYDVRNIDRNILVKVISETSNEIGDSIIKATNNQTAVSVATLHATDKIHRDIEDVMLKNDLFYERRINYYYNQGKELNSIFSPLYLASGYLALVLKDPLGARTLKEKFMNNPFIYRKIYDERDSLNIWPKIAVILRKTDNFIEKKRLKKGFKSYEGFLKGTRYIISLIAVSSQLGDFNFSSKALISFNTNKLTDKLYIDIWNLVAEGEKKEFDKSTWRKKAFLDVCLSKAAQIYAIKNLNSVTRRNQITALIMKDTDEMDDKLINLIDSELPEQPWKPGIHRILAKKINIYPQKVSDIISYLIFTGRRLVQKDGIVYDVNGNILLIDEERVDKDTLKLKETRPVQEKK